MKRPLAATASLSQIPLSIGLLSATGLLLLSLGQQLVADEQGQGLDARGIPLDRSSNHDSGHHTVRQRKRDQQRDHHHIYKRLTDPVYADGIGMMMPGPALRLISNRVFADSAQNLFSENGVTQWAYNWGQFIDHSIGLRESGDEEVEIAFDESDPLEHFSNSAQTLTMTRSAVAKRSGVDNAREQVNTVTSVIDGWAVYGGSRSRLEWLREGPVDGDLSNNGARLLLTTDGYLPPASSRGDAQSAPFMERVGQLHAIENPDDQLVVAGDVRANENIALTTVQTLFAREHNRLVDLLPADLSEKQKFEIAKTVLVGTQQYITYNEFLPAVGIVLPEASGYQRDVDPTVTNEFATVGYRAHSMIHGEIEVEVANDRYSSAVLQELSNQGIALEQEGSELALAVPLTVAFGNPQLVATIGLDALAAGLGGEPQYKNDEQIDNQLRSVLFQIASPDIEDPDQCLDGVNMPRCYRMVSDLGSLDVFRARDHGIASYNMLREGYGLTRINSFMELTGEHTEEFPTDDPLIDITNPMDDPAIMDFVELRDVDGNLIDLNSEAAESEAVSGVRRTTLAARLKAIYQDIDTVDAFVGMVSEPHLENSEFGELQEAMWKKQFLALRDGDPHHYSWNRKLHEYVDRYGHLGIDYQQTLSEVIINNTDLQPGDIQENMFFVAD